MSPAKETEISITDFMDIIYCKAEGTYTRIYLKNECVLVSKILKHYESILPSNIFLRISRGFLINKTHILRLIGNERVILITNDEIKISRRRRSKILKELSKTHLLIKK